MAHNRTGYGLLDLTATAPHHVADQTLSAMRKQFPGHAVKPAG